MHLRRAVSADAEAIRRVHAAAIRELGVDGYSREQVAAWAAGCETADYATPIASPDHDFLVAVDGDAVVAFGCLSAGAPAGYRADVDGELTAVYVHPSVARQGVGSAVYEALERRATDRGFGVLGLTASVNAVAFYDAHGFRPVRAYRHEFSSHASTGVTGTVVEMTKAL